MHEIAQGCGSVEGWSEGYGRPYIVEPVCLKGVAGSKEGVEVVRPEVVANVAEDSDPNIGLREG